MLQHLTKYRHLTHLDLSGNKVEKGGQYIAEMIESLKFNSQLQLLYLRDCSIPSHICGEILKCLKKCKQLSHLHLGKNNIGSHGKHLVDLIKNFGEDPPLQQLYLPNCSIPQVECSEMLQHLTKYRHLTHLNLNGNKVENGGLYIIKLIENLQLDSQMQLLYLRDCSIPSHICGEILKCLKKCKQLTHLDLGKNNIGSHGKHLVDLIKNFGEDPRLLELYLPSCSIPQAECSEMLQHLTKYRHLTHLNLNGNKVKNGGIHIVKMIENLESDLQLQLLYLKGCAIPSNICGEILKGLKKCKQLAHLNFGGNNIGSYGNDLVELIKNFGEDPPLQQLYLDNCSVSEEDVTKILEHLSTYQYLISLDLSGNILGNASDELLEIIATQTLDFLYLKNTHMPSKCYVELLQNLPKCKSLIYLSLEGNNLTGLLSHFLPNTDSILPSLRHLVLTNVGLNKDDVNHLKTLIECHRIPALGGPEDTDALFLHENNFSEMVDELENLLSTCLNEHQKELKIALWDNNLPDEFKEKWNKRCEGKHIKLFF